MKEGSTARLRGTGFEPWDPNRCGIKVRCQPVSFTNHDYECDYG